MKSIKKGDYIKLQKITDDVFNGRHPNNINKNHIVYGTMYNDITVGEALFLSAVSGDSHGFFHTSIITEIIDTNNFRTMNSTYHIEPTKEHINSVEEAERLIEELSNLSIT